MPKYKDEIHRFFCNCGYSCRTKELFLSHKHGTSMYYFEVKPGQQVPEHLQFRTPGERKQYRKAKNKTSKKR